MQEVTLATLVDQPDRRVRVSMSQNAEGETRLRLQDESLSEHVGWYVQGVLELSPDQISQLRSVLGNVPHTRPRTTPARMPALSIHRAG